MKRHRVVQNECKSDITWEEALYPERILIEDENKKSYLPFFFQMEETKPNHHRRIWHICPHQTYSKNHSTKNDLTEKIESLKNHHKINLSSSKNFQEKQIKTRAPPSFTGKLGKIDVLSTKNRPASEWHRYSPVTCNIIHESSILNGLTIEKSSEISSNDASTMHTNFTSNDNLSEVTFLSQGSQRASWVLINNNSDSSKKEKIIMKTLVWHKPYDRDKFTYQRVDALATERLTNSEYVVNAYGFCGMAVLNEYADGGDLFHYIKKHDNITLQQKFAFARDSTFGLRDIHAVDGPNQRTTLLHLDIKLHNFLVVKDRLKFHDFNNAHLLIKSKRAGKPRNIIRHINCAVKGNVNVSSMYAILTYYSSNHFCVTQIQQRAPEECMYPQVITEKMEVYRLGVFFFTLLTGKEPYNFEEEGHRPLSEVLAWILDKSRIPKLPVEIESSEERAIKTLIVAMRVCTRFNPMKRPSAKKLSEYFQLHL